MNQTPAPDPDIAARYFRGELSAKEADEFEDEFLGDARYRQLLEEQALLERYLRNDLSDSELDAVEKALVADPQLLDEMERLSAIEQGLEDLRESGAYTPQRTVSRTGSWFRSPQYAAAASVAMAGLLAFSGYLLVDNQSLRDEVDTFASLPIRIVPLETLRSDEAEPIEIQPAPAGVWTTLLLDAAYLEDGNFIWFDDYRATVTRNDDDDRAVVFEANGLPLNDDETVGVTISDRQLVPGSEYTLELDGRMDEWEADRGFESILSLRLEVLGRD